MKQLNYNDLQDIQLVDLRPQFAFQAGHIKNSLNLIPRNFETYSEYYLDKEKDLIFIVDQYDQEDLDEAIQIANEKRFNLLGYVLIENIPEEDLVTLDTATASKLLDQKEEDYILLDVRNADEITRPAPEKNLITIPLEELPAKLKELETDKKVYTLCGSGNRATAASSYLECKGYSTAVIEGGIQKVQEEQERRKNKI